MKQISFAEFISKEGLASIRLRAFRKRVWFKALTKVERAIIDLTIKYVKIIRSPILARVVGKIVFKILKALKSEFLAKVERVGRGRAEKICSLAVKWGNLGASSWKYDMKFVRFLGINAIYDDMFR
jgi:hypothetical protein